MKTFTEKQAAFMTILRGSVCLRHIESLFLYHASPVLRKAKPAVLVTVKPECVSLWKNRERAMCKATGLCLKELQSKNSSSSLFPIYDRIEIEIAVRNEKSLSILNEFGYELDGNIDEFLGHLSQRFTANDFPHEIGLFLGYPPGDVKAYIENEGKNCACCRYWKAYEDVEMAQRMWARIDEAQRYAIDVLENLPPIHIAANLLKAV